jgi:type I restriction enzyme S subunit
MKRYTKYKPTGIEWIGEIPEHWKVERLKLLTTKIGDGIHTTPEYTENSDYFFINGTNLDNGVIEINSSVKTASEDEYKKYRIDLIKGTILISLNGTIGKIAFYNNEKIILGKSVAYVECINQICKEFIFFIFKSSYILYYFETSLGGTTIKNLSLFTLRNTPIPLPPLPEQKAIAEYLDKTTQAIDSTIAIKEKQIETIEQYFRSKLHEVVTGGLNPNVKRKPSGVDWIGEIPEHWKVERIKDICLEFFGGGTPNTSVEEYWKGGTIPWVSPKDMKSTYIYETEDYINEIAVKNSATHLVQIDSLLVVIRSGILKHTLPVSINKVVVTINQDLKALDLLKGFHSKFIYYSILSNSDLILAQSSKVGATVESLETKDFLGFKLIFPPLSEQKAIAEYLDTLREKVESITKTLREQIEVLKEYRKSLIHECVTGKRKVV